MLLIATIAFPLHFVEVSSYSYTIPVNVAYIVTSGLNDVSYDLETIDVRSNGYLYIVGTKLASISLYHDAVVLEVVPNGSIICFKLLNSSGYDYGYGILASYDGLYVVGFTDSDDLSAVDGVGYVDGFLLKFSYNETLETIRLIECLLR